LIGGWLINMVAMIVRPPFIMTDPHYEVGEDLKCRYGFEENIEYHFIIQAFNGRVSVKSVSSDNIERTGMVAVVMVMVK
jgi:hypothetical protein